MVKRATLSRSSLPEDLANHTVADALDLLFDLSLHLVSRIQHGLSLSLLCKPRLRVVDRCLHGSRSVDRVEDEHRPVVLELGDVRGDTGLLLKLLLSVEGLEGSFSSLDL